MRTSPGLDLVTVLEFVTPTERAVYIREDIPAGRHRERGRVRTKHPGKFPGSSPGDRRDRAAVVGAPGAGGRIAASRTGEIVHQYPIIATFAATCDFKASDAWSMNTCLHWSESSWPYGGCNAYSAW
jgi:hypothetical protein